MAVTQRGGSSSIGDSKPWVTTPMITFWKKAAEVLLSGPVATANTNGWAASGCIGPGRTIDTPECTPRDAFEPERTLSASLTAIAGLNEGVAER